jgi:hypothetical protein
VLITGIDPEPIEEGLVRVYVGPRYLWRFVLVDLATAEDLRRQWGGDQHLYADLAEDAVVYQGEKP